MSEPVLMLLIFLIVWFGCAASHIYGMDDAFRSMQKHKDEGAELTRVINEACDYKGGDK